MSSGTWPLKRTPIASNAHNTWLLDGIVENMASSAWHSSSTTLSWHFWLTGSSIIASYYFRKSWTITSEYRQSTWILDEPVDRPARDILSNYRNQGLGQASPPLEQLLSRILSLSQWQWLTLLQPLSVSWRRPPPSVRLIKALSCIGLLMVLQDKTRQAVEGVLAW